MEAAPVTEQYPQLFKRTTSAYAVAAFTVEGLPPDELVSNVNVVPFVGDQCVVIRLENGDWEIPGGTLEPEEAYSTTIRRELLEEAGAELVSPFVPFGAWRSESLRDEPYRPHLPFPVYYRLVGYGEVRIVSQPLIPEEGGEHIVAVEVVSVREAMDRFQSCERPDIAELYGLADALRTGRITIA